MNLTTEQEGFLADHHAAAMITTGKSGTPKVARVSIEVVDGRLWSSGTEDRVRTARLRRDPRCSLFVFDTGWRWLTLETVVTILDGPDMPAQQVRLFRQMQNRPSGDLDWWGKTLSEADFIRTMQAERRLIYEFEITHAYGMI